ncbi:AAA family ATPase [Sphingobium xenophagum]|uniref:AAA family ATPase n=2 Tax=Sphingomonadaceae TaxID=41297 RepID=UPI0002EBA245|nr:AAA family ATPase [Sphingobium xenophagum]
MRILAIRGRNLASLEGDFAVDFTAEPLESAGIFAITGPTGAGKSTLLDAMCLALFNRLPRLAYATGGQVGAEGGEAISASDQRAVLRHRAGEGYAEVDFIGRDQVRYRARWTVRRARGKADGALQNIGQEFSNLDTGDRIGGTRTETLEAIRDRVGLTAEQFTRAVMLAQGEFDAFVRADANDRAALLEKLTGTGIYAQLGVAAKRKADGLRVGLAQIEQRIADQRGLDDVARADAEGKLAEARAMLALAGEELARFERERQWHTTAAGLAERVAATQTALATARAAQAEAGPRREALLRRRTATAFVAEWKAAEDAKTKAARGAEHVTKLEAELRHAQAEAERLATAEQEASNALRRAEAALESARPVLEQARALDGEIDSIAAELAPLEVAKDALTADLDRAESDWEAAEQQRRDGEAELAALGEWIAANEARRALALRDEALTSDLAEQAALTEQALRVSMDAKVVATEVVDCSKARAEAEQTAAAAAGAHAAAQAQLEQAQTTMPLPQALEAATRRRDALAAVEPKLDAVENHGARVAQLEREAAQITLDRERETEALGRDRSEAGKIEADLPQIRARLDEARRSSALSEAAADEAAVRLRATLLPGEPCPVCGSHEHEVDAVTALIEGRVADDLARVGALDEDVRKQERRMAVLADREAATGQRIAGLEAQAQRSAKALTEAHAGRTTARAALEVATAAANLGLGADLAEFRATLAQRLTEADAYRTSLEGARQAFEDARAEAERHRAARDHDDAVRLAALEAERDAMSREADLARRLADLSDRRDRLGAALDAELSLHFDWAGARDPQENLARLVREWRTYEAEHKTAAAAMPEFIQAVHAADLARTQIRAARDQAEASVAKFGERHQCLTDQRAPLLGGEATAVVSRRLDEALRIAATTSEAARTTASSAHAAYAAAEASLQSRRETQSADEIEAGRRLSELSAKLDGMGLTSEAVAAEAHCEEGSLAAEQKALELLDEAVTRAEAEHAARAQDHASHIATDVPDLLPDALAVALANAEAEQAQAREIEGEAALVIRQDDAARAATAVLRAEHADRQAEAQVWLRLDALIGDSTGNKFRRFAQGLTLDRLLGHANVRLAELKPRYELQRGAGGDMLVQVIDHDLAGEVRGLHNLSGGERFLVSLALALGLSEMSTGQGLRIESLFIDEGFGALDSASLGAAIAMLEQLHATGRRVGVISHIEEVKERIPVKIAVTPVARGRSVVEVLAE